ncbi:hypothetical protein [Undibacterium sp. TJN19]|uniref:hypothetical protein n=1 Tax=Undibacterium sp. TJN19 TaxID=3413055 RepID=UPI003BF0C67C
MNAAMLTALVVNEVRLRMRRLGTIVTLLAIIAIGWSMIPDPQSGTTLIAISEARVLYTSSALALGSATLSGFLFGLAGFYLARGRIAEDLRSGTGGVIAATQVGNTLFLFSRWLGGVVYLISLILAFLGTMLVCHALRGDGPIEIGIYLQTYAVILLPMVFFSISCAILFDSFSPLMGKLGDVIFFFIWIAEISLMSKIDTAAPGQLSPLLYFDFSGLAMSMINLKTHLDIRHLSLGTATFNVALTPVMIPAWLWSTQFIGMRCVTAALAILPLLPAIALFHRFSPDYVKMARAQKRRSPLEYLNHFLRPLSKLAQPLFRLAQSVPGMPGQVLADIALTVVTAPAASATLIVMALISIVCPLRALPGLLSIAVAVWGILISDISTRDTQAATAEMTGTVSGGIRQRYLRQFAATVILGLLLTAVIAIRWSAHEPLRAVALVSGVFSMSAMAMLLGRMSGSSRTFIALFLFGLYVIVNATGVALLDVFGFNGAANMQSILLQTSIGSTACLAGYIYNPYAANR